MVIQWSTCFRFSQKNVPQKNNVLGSPMYSSTSPMILEWSRNSKGFFNWMRLINWIRREFNIPVFAQFRHCDLYQMNASCQFNFTVLDSLVIHVTYSCNVILWIIFFLISHLLQTQINKSCLTFRETFGSFLLGWLWSEVQKRKSSNLTV